VLRSGTAKIVIDHLDLGPNQRQRRDQVDATVVPNVRRQRGAAPASCARLQSRQFPAHAGDAGADQGLVADESEGKADQDRREGGGHGRYVIFQMAEVAIPRQLFQEILRLIAKLLPQPPQALAETFDVMHSRATDRRSASKCQGKSPDQTLDQALGLPEVLVAVSTSCLSCKRAAKMRTLCRFEIHLENLG
jgi:hypothetical protein